MKQIIIITLIIFGFGLVQSTEVSFDCVLKECASELKECFQNPECKQQYDIMTQCYSKSSSQCFSQSFFGDRLITEDCISECLNECKVQTLEGSNVISCQLDKCEAIPKWDVFGLFQGQQNKAYVVAWVTFFVIISVIAFIVWYVIKD